MPGTAKTLLVRTLASALGLTFKRIQFTPDLMPTDVTGTDILEEDQTTGKRTWTFVQGPLFTNVLLADEINRTPPKTQSALLEAMQEFSVTVRGHHHKIERPFFVLATQNPIELEGTYPLPEAQLDRFLFNVLLDYLSADDEVDVVNRNTTRMELPEIKPCTTPEQILQFQWLVRQVPPERPERARDGQKVRPVRSERSRDAVHHARREGARADARPLSRHARGRRVAGAAGHAASRADELLRGVGWHRYRQGTDGSRQASRRRQ
jgi:MoxR-like ATPase